MRLRTWTLPAALIVLGSTAALALSSPFKNIGDISRGVGFGSYAKARSSGTLKIAVLDNGFRDHAKQIGKTLPSNTTYHAGPIAVDAATEESHGLFMAQLLSGLLAQAPGVDYELHLFSAFGWSNFEASVNQVISDKFDIVLYAQVWEYGGNGDGRGFINTLVNKATSAGITWVNASGNFGSGTFKAAIEAGDDEWAKLPGPNQSVRVRCKTNKKNKCGLRAVLSWNDFSDDVNVGSDKDLDLLLTDDTLKIVGSSAFQQMTSIPEGMPGASLYPREIITKEVKPGVYLLRAKMRSKNFDKKRDTLRLTVSGDYLEILDRSSDLETILPPGDNASVISVGANDSERSSNSARLKKPELSTPSKVVLANGEEYRGSSNSAAIAAAAVSLLKALHPEYSRRDLIQELSSGASFFQGDKGQGLPLEALGFQPTSDHGCFKMTNLPYTPPPIASFMKKGGVAVETSRGVKIFMPVDPFPITDSLRVSPDDMLVVNKDGFESLPRSNQEFLPFGSYEVLQQPQGQAVCPVVMGGSDGAKKSGGAILKLPAK